MDEASVKDSFGLEGLEGWDLKPIGRLRGCPVYASPKIPQGEVWLIYTWVFINVTASPPKGTVLCSTARDLAQAQGRA